MNTTPLCRNAAVAGLVLTATVLSFVPILSAQQSNTPITLDAALAHARQHSPRLSATRQGVTTEEAAVAAARAEQLPRFSLGAAVRGSSQLTQTALGLPLTPLADVPENQPFSRGHLNAEVLATIPVYTGGRIRSAVRLAQVERDLAQVGVRDVERELDFDVTSAYASLV